jgi:exonuclease SbcC
MKFKKVEIQAFRAYAHVADGTFDFELTPNEYADFVSIYAPNGFGKTSFYDAVEWGYTKNIHRFLRKHKFNLEVAKSEKNINELEQQYILKNRDATDLEGFVRLYTTASDSPIENKIEIKRKGSIDYKFKEKETVRSYFQQVILSQEWIDAFLKEDNGSDRYRTFIDYFGDMELDQYYRDLISLLRTNENTITSLQEQLKGLQLELTFDGDTEILTKINEQISKANQLGVNLPLLEGSPTEKDLLHFTNIISEKQNEANFSMQRDEQSISFIETAFIGDNSTPNIDKYFQLKQLLEELEKTEELMADLLKDFKQKQEVQQAVAVVNEKTKLTLKARDELTRLMASFPLYSEVVRQIQLNEKQQAENNLIIKQLEEKLAVLRLEDTDIQVKIANQLKQLQDLTQKINDLPLKEEIMIKLKINTTDLLKKKEVIQADIELVKEEVNRLAKERTTLQIALSQLQNEQLTELSPEILASYQDPVAEIHQIETSEEDLAQEILSLDELIQRQNSLISDLEQFIAKGIEIIHSTRASSCPLCTYAFESYDALARTLSNNKVLPSQLMSYLQQKAVVETSLLAIRINKKECLSGLIDTISGHLTQLDIPWREAEETLANQMLQELMLEDRLKLLSEESLKIQTYFGSSDPETYKEKLQYELEVNKKVIESMYAEQSKLSKEIDQDSEQLELLTKHLLMRKETLTTLAADSTYNQVLLFHQKWFETQSFSEKLYEQRLVNLESKLLSHQEEVNVLHQRQAAIESNLKNNDQKSCEEQLQAIQSQKKILQRELVSFEQFVESKLSIQVSGASRKQIEKMLNERRFKIKENTTIQDKLNEHYSLLLQLKENVLPYLKFERAKQTDIEIRKRIKLLKLKVKPELEVEKKKVSSFIDEQIKSFFYEDLINDIYRKMDPHPEYKQIKFICDFTDDKPQLNVSVTNKDQDRFLIPNLYFSTAQLNILSLSIFLAKALNACDEKENPVDCIFIDDPIQSMDSINVLSTIDLLRSIVVNSKKQIILSTHDENFHQLLQKKLPPGLFKSKFIELETFGKVKR